jgi:drug/metabolite transporter (DMT)-like permease
MSRQRAIIELLLAGVLWGFGFVATVWALIAFTPSELLILRFLVTFLVREILWFLLFRKNSPGEWRKDFRLSIPAGVLLASMMLPQTIGLQYTTASKSGFLTTLYILIIPLLHHFVLHTKIKRIVYVYAVTALFGAALLMDADLSNINPGDLWTILCAFLAAVHILYIERISAKISDSFRFNTFQSLFCLICLLPMLAFQPKITLWTWEILPLVGVLCLAIGSSTIAFTIQIRAQKVLSSTSASMMFLLESPFSLLFGIWFLNEGFNTQQALGAVIILSAAALTLKSDAAP